MPLHVGVRTKLVNVGPTNGRNECGARLTHARNSQSQRTFARLRPFALLPPQDCTGYTRDSLTQLTS